MSGHATVEMPEAGSSRSDSSGSLVLFTYLKTTQEESEKMVTWEIIFIEVVVFVLFLGGLIATLTDHLVKKNHVIWVFPTWKWCVLVLVIVGSRRIAGWMIDVVVSLVEKKSLDSTKNKKFPVYDRYYIYSLKKSIRAVLWFGSVLLTWVFLFKSDGVKASKFDSHLLKYVRRTIATSIIGGFLWALKTLLVNALSSPLQAKRLFDRFRECLIDKYILHVFSANDNGAQCRQNVDKWIKDNHLRRYDRITAANQEKKNDRNIAGGHGEVKVINWLKKMEPEELSGWIMKELIELIMTTQLSSITEELENLAKKEQDKNILFEKTQDVANQIFRRMNSSREIIEESTLKTLFIEEAGDVVQHINGGEEVRLSNEEAGDVVQDINGGEKMAGIGRQALREWLVDAVVERRSLAQSLENTKRNIKELNKLISVTALTMLFILWLIMLGILTTEVLVAILTQFAALAFTFGDTGKSIFKGIEFVFVMHPIDIGDCCVIDGEKMVVERIDLLSSVFRKNWKDRKIFPNSVLTALPIRKFKKVRSHLIINDFVEIFISSSTSKDQIQGLRVQIASFMAKHEHKDKWLQEHDFNLKEIEDQKLKIVLGVAYRKTDLSDWKMMNSRRDILLLELMDLLKQKEITYYNILPKAVDAE